MYHEEELKRLHAALSADSSYQQVAYSYDDKGGVGGRSEDGQVASGEALDEEGVPFVPPQQLDVPPDMEVPSSWRLHAIITRTATFVSQQGMQMEILLKAKQADNPNFVFLQFGSPLHPYYRHVLGAIRAGRYRPQTEANEDKDDMVDGEDDEEGDDHYLHPSLAASSATTIRKVELAPSIPSVPYKPSADCSYSQLVSRIRGRQAALGGTDAAASEAGEEKPETVPEEAPISPEPPPPGEEAEAPLTPPSDMQLIIDKMASYVAKNGREFEIIVRARGDPRFEFLDDGHPFHEYYEHKLLVYCEDDKDKKEKSVGHKKPKNTAAAGPVCFSIRPKESECTLGQRSALPVEDSTDEEEENQGGQTTAVTPGVPVVAPLMSTLPRLTTSPVEYSTRVASSESRAARLGDGESRKGRATDNESRMSRVSDGESRKTRTMDGESRKARVTDGESRKSRAADVESRNARSTSNDVRSARTPPSEMRSRTTALNDHRNARTPTSDSRTERTTSGEARQARSRTGEARSTRASPGETRSHTTSSETHSVRTTANESSTAIDEMQTVHTASGQIPITTSVAEVLSTSVADSVVPAVAPAVVADPQKIQQERRRKAALFLSKLQVPVVKTAPVSNGSSSIQVDEDDVESLPSPTTPPSASPPLTPPSPPRLGASALREDGKIVPAPPPPPISLFAGHRKSRDRHVPRDRRDRDREKERERERERKHSSKLGHHTRPHTDHRHPRPRSRSKNRHHSSRSHKVERRKRRRRDRSSSVSSSNSRRSSSAEERRTSRR